MDKSYTGFGNNTIVRIKITRLLGLENGFPLLPVSEVTLHTARRADNEVVACFANYVIESFRSESWRANQRFENSYARILNPRFKAIRFDPRVTLNSSVAHANGAAHRPMRQGRGHVFLPIT